MVALTSQTIENSYGDLLQISNNNNGADTTIRPIKDGKDDSTPLKLSLTQIQLDYAVWPISDGSNGQVLTTDGNGGLSWTTASSGTTQDLWLTVASDSGSTSANSTSDTLNIQGGTDISTSVSGDTVTIDWTGSTSGVTQNLWDTFTADSGSTTANTTTDTFNIQGGSDISTSISGDTLTVNFTGSSSGITEVVQDTTPQLGGDLDLQNNSLTNVSNDFLDNNNNVILGWTAQNNSNNYIQVSNDAGFGPEINAAGADNDISLQLNARNNGSIFLNGNNFRYSSPNGLAFQIRGDIASIENRLEVKGVQGGQAPVIQAEGTSDFSVDIKLSPKGSGKVNISNILYPNTDGNNGQILTTDGAGTLSFSNSLKSYSIETNANSSSTNSITFDVATDNAHTVTLTEDITSITVNADTSGANYQQLIIEFTQDGTGGRTVSGWPASVTWPGGTAPTITSAANSVDVVTLQTFDGGTTWRGNYSQDYK